ncbi:hypothetical protein O181_128617 [Austropuccinia psidii MF-1]|uniref:Transposase Tc1-like domain-containing protein n=1 Tax=Austropuccinia psidii MF-1 TaxID=1389203 RepID=A0A9Q3L081_9BASI|nr:hypothetical protein [Austropuccinia psidii MF-1]
MPYLDVETRGQLVGMRQAGLSFRAIAELNDLSLTTVYKTFQKYQEIGTVTTQKKTGQPTKLNDRDWRQLSRIITRCQRLTVAQVASLMTSLVSTLTIQREINKLGKHSRIAPRKPYLRPQDFQRRLAFAQAHRHWTINEWAKVIWTDESAFELGKRVDQVRVWRTAKFARNGPTGLLPGSLPLHRANGASPVDTRLTLPPANGRQRTHPYSSFQQSMARTKRNTQDGVAGTFARPQSDRKHLEVDEKPNIEALPTSDG